MGYPRKNKFFSCKKSKVAKPVLSKRKKVSRKIDFRLTNLRYFCKINFRTYSAEIYSRRKRWSKLGLRDLAQKRDHATAS